MRRLVLLAAVLAYAVAGLAWLARDPAGPAETREPGSTFDDSPSGASLAWAYLSSRGARVERLVEPLRPGAVPKGAVVLRVRGGRAARRERPLEKGETRRTLAEPLLTPSEEEWVRGGGRLVLALAHGRAGLQVQAAPSSPPPRKVHPLWAAVSDLRPSPRRRLGGPALEEAATLFASGDDAVVVRLARGRGDVVLLACPEVLENGLLARADHLALLAALAGSGRPVYFDEHAHGLSASRGLLALLLEWGLGPALLLGSLAGLAVLWRGRARVGPPADPWEDTRTDAVDLAGSLAQLYEGALRRDEAAALYYEALRREAALRTGLRGAALDKHLRALTRLPAPPRRGKGGDISDAELASVLARINAAFGGLGHAHSR